MKDKDGIVYSEVEKAQRLVQIYQEKMEIFGKNNVYLLPEKGASLLSDCFRFVVVARKFVKEEVIKRMTLTIENVFEFSMDDPELCFGAEEIEPLTTEMFEEFLTSHFYQGEFDSIKECLKDKIQEDVQSVLGALLTTFYSLEKFIPVAAPSSVLN